MGGYVIDFMSVAFAIFLMKIDFGQVGCASLMAIIFCRVCGVLMMASDPPSAVAVLIVPKEKSARSEAGCPL